MGAGIDEHESQHIRQNLSSASFFPENSQNTIVNCGVFKTQNYDQRIERTNQISQQIFQVSPTTERHQRFGITGYKQQQKHITPYNLLVVLYFNSIASYYITKSFILRANLHL